MSVVVFCLRTVTASIKCGKLHIAVLNSEAMSSKFLLLNDISCSNPIALKTFCVSYDHLGFQVGIIVKLSW